MNKKLFRFVYGVHPSSVDEVEYQLEGRYITFHNHYTNKTFKLDLLDEMPYIEYTKNKNYKLVYAFIDLDDPANYIDIIDVESDDIIASYPILHRRSTTQNEKRIYVIQTEKTRFRAISVSDLGIGVPQIIPLISDRPVYFKFKNRPMVPNSTSLLASKNVFINKNISLQKKIDLNLKAITKIDILQLTKTAESKKELIYVGMREFINKEEFFTYDYSEFYTKDGTVVDAEDLDFWAYILDNPCSQETFYYTIKANYGKNDYIKADPNRPKFYCEYRSTGPECIIYTFRGYGDTAIEAMNNCEVLMQSLKDKYMKEDDE